MAVGLVMLTPVLILVTGLVVDSAGKIQADADATSVAQSAARAGANAGVRADARAAGNRIDLAASEAETAARNYLDAAGLPGAVTSDGSRVQVEATKEYRTRFLSVIGWNSLTGRGTATAEVRSGR